MGHLNTILVPRRVEFEPTKLQKFKTWGFPEWEVAGGGGVGGNFKLIDALGYGQSLLKGSKIEQPGHY